MLEASYSFWQACAFLVWEGGDITCAWFLIPGTEIVFKSLPFSFYYLALLLLFSPVILQSLRGFIDASHLEFLAMISYRDFPYL